MNTKGKASRNVEALIRRKELLKRVKSMPADEVAKLLAGKKGKTKRDFVKHIQTMRDADVLKLGASSRRTILTPMSGKARPDRTDIEIMQADREALEMLLRSVLANKRLTWLIVSAYLDEHKMVLSPVGWIGEELKAARAAV
ncbi:MAG: hypothetical protein C4583_04280 [Anaerolineaceae bacterium]|nr:MAG: hypothetical protein C4583_04280 [Anaerolineaceae bacterium]